MNRFMPWLHVVAESLLGFEGSSVPFPLTLARSPNLQVDVLTEDTFVEARDSLAHAFCDIEPTTAGLGCSEEEMIFVLDDMRDEIIADRVSLVAQDRETGKVAAALVNRRPGPKSAQSDSDEEDFLDVLRENEPGWKYSNEILAQLKDEFLSDRCHSSDAVIAQEDSELLYVYVGSVEEEARGLGLLTALVGTSVSIAEEVGMHGAITECTNEFSISADERAGGVVHHELLYKDFESEDGTMPLRFVNEWFLQELAMRGLWKPGMPTDLATRCALLFWEWNSNRNYLSQKGSDHFLELAV